MSQGNARRYSRSLYRSLKPIVFTQLIKPKWKKKRNVFFYKIKLASKKKKKRKKNEICLSGKFFLILPPPPSSLTNRFNFHYGWGFHLFFFLGGGMKGVVRTSAFGSVGKTMGVQIGKSPSNKRPPKRKKSLKRKKMIQLSTYPHNMLIKYIRILYIIRIFWAHIFLLRVHLKYLCVI